MEVDFYNKISRDGRRKCMCVSLGLGIRGHGRGDVATQSMGPTNRQGEIGFELSTLFGCLRVNVLSLIDDYLSFFLW